tara:strand:+ start:861 stop:1442 length:582 start_codon:yes stop_codon:yes gene_type:complete
MFNTINKNTNAIWGQEVPEGAQSSSQFLRIADEDKCFQTEGEVFKLYLNTSAGQPVDPNNAGNNVNIPINIPMIKTLPQGAIVYVSSIQIDNVPATGFIDLRSDTFMDSQRYESVTGQKSNILKRVSPVETLQLFNDMRNTSGTTIRDAQALNFQQVHILLTDDRQLPIPITGAGGDQAFIELTIIMPYAKTY